MAISEDQLFDTASSRVHDLWSRNFDGAKFFVQFFAALLGGTLWLKANIHHILPQHVALSDLLAFLLSALCCAMTWDNVGTWAIWRERLARITKGSPVEIAPVNSLAKYGTELLVTGSIMLACVGFIIFNPLASI